MAATDIGQAETDLRERAERAAARLDALERINAATNSAMDVGEALEAVARAVAGALGADLCAIFLFDQPRREVQLRATNGPRPRGGMHYTLRVGEGYSGAVAENGQPLTIHDARVDPRLAAEASAYPTPYAGLAAIPIIYFAVEHLVGVLDVQSIEPRTFAPDEISFLEVVAGQLAMNIENGRLYAQTDEAMRRKVHELNTLQQVSQLVASSLELTAVLETIVTRAVQLSGAERSILFELDPATARLRPIAAHGFAHDFTQDAARVEWPGVLAGQCCAGRALHTGEPQSNLECMGSDAGCFFRDHQDAVGDLHAVLCVPLSSTHGAKGALCVYSPRRFPFSPDQLQSVVTFANVAAIAMDNARLFEQTRAGLETNAILVREMHHRVKNNLQQVGSILRMQRRRAHSPQVERILGESLGRIQGIAETHELLSRESTEQLAHAAIDEIARKIAGVVQGNSLVPPDLDLRIDVAPFPAYVPSEQATILAIVLNELIANAIEHGFGERARGQIQISGAQHDGLLSVRVADDGAGPPPGFDPQTSDGLGLAVIRKLVGSDLHGTFTLRREMDPTPPPPPLHGEGEPEAEPSADTGSGAAADADGWTVVEITFPAAPDGAPSLPATE
ncbi:MAG TPA: GAF domain-containing protein [Ktedonobacterales bacterium]